MNKQKIRHLLDKLYEHLNAADGLRDEILTIALGEDYDSCYLPIYVPNTKKEVAPTICKSVIYEGYDFGEIGLENYSEFKIMLYKALYRPTNICPLGTPNELYTGICFASIAEDAINIVADYMEGVDYYDPRYRKARHAVFIRDGEVCAKCGATPKPGISLTIDHIKPVSKHPELFLDENNMQVLCWPCNQQKSNKHETDYR